MRKILIVLLALAGILGGAAPGFAQSPIGLYGTWASVRYPGSGGQIRLADIVVNAGGALVVSQFEIGAGNFGWRGL